MGLSVGGLIHRGGGGGGAYMWIRKSVKEMTDIIRQNENLYLQK